MDSNKINTFLVLIISIGLFLLVLESNFSAMQKFILSVLILGICGYFIGKINNIESHYGLLLARTKRGLAFIDKLSKEYPNFWKKFTKIGLIIGYGSLAYFLAERKPKLKDEIPYYILGTIILVITSILISAGVSTLILMIKGGEEFSSAKIQKSSEMQTIISILSFILLVIGGIFLLTTGSIIFYAIYVVNSLIAALTKDLSIIKSTPPGGMPIIPGINIDLVGGLASLIIILLVHEGLHGIIARLYRIPLRSSGIVFFGFIPVGAFVDVDEKKLFSEKKEKQNAVLIAGITANFIVGILSFLILIILYNLFITLGLQSEIEKQILRFFALLFSLNLLVGAINLLPMPLFDGGYIIRNLIGNKTASKLIEFSILIAFLVNLLPWLFR
jgi:Zn-dependent protease